MNRSGYTEDYGGGSSEELCYRNAVDRAIRGKRGQRFLRELITALDAMPVKELARGSFHDQKGKACALGALADYRGQEIPVFPIDHADEWYEGDVPDAHAVGKFFDIAQSLARETMYTNDDFYGDDASRWRYVRNWASRQKETES